MPKIPLSKPDIGPKEIQAVLGVLKTPHLSLGKQYQAFEAACAKQAGVKYAVAVNSGTSALHLIVKAMGIGPGDEVITTPFSFIASANCILYERATPVFADIDPETLCIDPKEVEKKITAKTKAILAVDVFSRPADWDALRKIAKKHRLLLIEDSAEAIGSAYDGKPCGGFGDAAVFSFYPNKQITAGEGGMVLTNDRGMYEACRSMANQGRQVEGGAWLDHVRLGYNYRMDEMSAALGLAQIRRLKEIIRKRNAVASWYKKHLGNIAGLQVPAAAPRTTLGWFVYVVVLDERYAGAGRDRVIATLEKQGIQARNYFVPIHLQPFYAEEFGYRAGDYPVTESIAKRTVALPFYTGMKAAEVARVAKSLASIMETL